MSSITKIKENVYKGSLNPKKGFIGNILKQAETDIIIGHPTFKNEDNIGKQLKSGIEGIKQSFPDKKVAFIVSDGTYNSKSNDTKTIETALNTASELLENNQNIIVFAGPYDGYDGDYTPGKGSALKMIFEEMAFTNAQTLIMLDGDLRNDMGQWQKVYKKVIDKHNAENPDKSFFITAKYARHFVDASLTRNIVGPLTTLMGKYVPGGISGDIVLSRGAVELERKGEWNDARRRYGTDISTTFDNIANNTVIYEVYLGAKLHDVTDDAKLSVMPGEVIGAALERLLYYEKLDKRVTELMKTDKKVLEVVRLGSDFTGIDFINPGCTNVFKLEAKRATLLNKYPTFENNMKTVLRKETFEMVKNNYEELKKAEDSNAEQPLFMQIDKDKWINILYEAVGYTLATEDLENSKKALNYLYTAAFLEFCKNKLFELGYDTKEKIEKAQSNLGIEDDVKAEPFYKQSVDEVVKNMAMEFYAGRKKILDRINEIKGA